MMWNPSDLAVVAYALVVGALLTEAYLTYRDWYRRRGAAPPDAPPATGGPALPQRRRPGPVWYRDIAL